MPGAGPPTAVVKLGVEVALLIAGLLAMKFKSANPVPLSVRGTLDVAPEKECAFRSSVLATVIVLVSLQYTKTCTPVKVPSVVSNFVRLSVTAFTGNSDPGGLKMSAEYSIVLAQAKDAPSASKDATFHALQRSRRFIVMPGRSLFILSGAIDSVQLYNVPLEIV